MKSSSVLALTALGILGAFGCSREETETPPVGVAEVSSPEVTARAIDFLHEHRLELKMRSPKEELSGVRAIKDDLAMTHVRMRQVERGVRVIGGEAVVHYDAAGGVRDVHQRYVPDLERLDVVPTLDAAKVRTLLPEGEEVVGEPELVIFAFDGHAPTLAWELKVIGARHTSWLVTLDAHSGGEIDRISQQHSAKGTGIGVSGKKRDIEFTSSAGKLQLIDQTRTFTLTTLDAKQSSDTRRATILLGASASSWDTTSRLGPGSAVDAQANIALVVDYYSNKFGRKSWDDKSGDISIVVHVGDDQDGQPGMDNAYYDQVSNLMAFGDGRELLRPTAGFLDVTAHEFTHAVTFYTSNLRYENQSGALNESVSDVFGAMVEHAVAPDDTKNWLMGEGSMLDPNVTCMRNMMDPAKGFQPQPSHMKEFERTTEDQGGVHTNSGIPNKAAQLMTVGGKHAVSGVNVARGLGWEKAEKVWYRTSTMYLTETSTFADAAKATMTAGKDIQLTQEELNIIDCAWKAVGVVEGSCGKITPASTSPTTGDDDDSASPGRGDDDDDSTSGDDDDDSKGKTSKKKKSTRKSTGSAATSSCSTTSPGASGGALPWLAVVGALLLARRRRDVMR